MYIRVRSFHFIPSQLLCKNQFTSPSFSGTNVCFSWMGGWPGAWASERAGERRAGDGGLGACRQGLLSWCRLGLGFVFVHSYLM